MKHVHHDLLRALADDASLKFEYKLEDTWYSCGNLPIFDLETEYRIQDPYRPFKEALAAGKTVQHYIVDQWYDENDMKVIASRSIKCLRIKPKPVVKTTKNIIVNDTGKTGGVKCTWYDDELISCEVVK